MDAENLPGAVNADAGYAGTRGSQAAPLHHSAYADAGYTIAAYLRISEHDDGRDESCSITYQRAMIKNYIAQQSEFSGAEIIDYVDDGISGNHTQREAYQRLMGDISRGMVQCIVVKDVSRIGRDMIDVDDLLMNTLVVKGVRFIAINNYYDSLKNPLSNLELSLINLASQHYNRDIAQKSISNKVTKMKKGEYLSCWALFGYKKSTAERNKIDIDEESAEYVRLIFSLAMDGNGPSKIAQLLNAQGVPTPSEYKKKHGIIGGWKQADPDFTYWCNALVSRLLNEIRYTGVSVHNVHKIKEPGKKNCIRRPKEEWITVPDAHDAIVTKDEFDKAHAAIRRERLSDVPIDHIFYKKIKCPVCNRTLKRSNPLNPWFKCMSRYYTDHYDCPDCIISQATIEVAVLESVKVYAAAMVDREEMKLAAIAQKGISKAEVEGKIKMEIGAIKTLENSITGNITSLVSGKITQEMFLSKKETINGAISDKEAELERLRGELKALCEGKGSIDQKLSELRPLMTVEKLDRELIDLLIDKVLVHGEKDIEIIWMDCWEGGCAPQ
ncbi:MAG: recombinase family protein [Oscillospiraceae bacterium]|nr:recombinase family protein [Oscillospiraceae bacterium]